MEDSYLLTAWEHAEADVRCGRAWSCACGACKIARRISPKRFLVRIPRSTRYGIEWTVVAVEAEDSEAAKLKATQTPGAGVFTIDPNGNISQLSKMQVRQTPPLPEKKT